MILQINQVRKKYKKIHDNTWYQNHDLMMSQCYQILQIKQSEKVNIMDNMITLTKYNK